MKRFSGVSRSRHRPALPPTRPRIGGWTFGAKDYEVAVRSLQLVTDLVGPRCVGKRLSLSKARNEAGRGKRVHNGECLAPVTDGVRKEHLVAKPLGCCIAAARFLGTAAEMTSSEIVVAW